MLCTVRCAHVLVALRVLRHQNPECVAYKLMHNNCGEPFRWRINVQLISKFYLKKHTSQMVTYIHKPKGVCVDNPKGMFILQLYKEVDKNGKELEGYQNPECAAYKLTYDNDGAAFQWTPNVQLISKVYLKKHTSQGRTYILNKKDAKMVKDSMRNRDSP